ncbi:MAG: hypothetical protein AAGH45_11640, partial [Pseudomonadota bacterium]
PPGGEGSDRLQGGGGRNRLKGGDGADVFLIDAAAPGLDIIWDLSPGVDRLAIAGVPPIAVSSLKGGARQQSDGTVLEPAPGKQVLLKGLTQRALSALTIEPAS